MTVSICGMELSSAFVALALYLAGASTLFNSAQQMHYIFLLEAQMRGDEE